MRVVGRWVTVVVAVLLLIAGGVATWAAAEQAGGGGWFSTPREEFRTSARALVTDELEVSTGRPGDPSNDIGELGAVRVRVDRVRGEQPLFVGIARRGDVDRYLRDVAHERLARVHNDPFRADFTRAAGNRTPARPGDQHFWVATGSDTRDLVWDKSHGTWTLVVMNADASPDIAIRADIGLRFGSLPWIAAGLLTAAALLGGLWFVGRRRRRAAPE
ncbi:hypothetical protein G5C51_02090 [Streptomyces sp. A7024]|uniref:Uncharacterized protein n=1 Tax=Streptomyces coryli TaxID=1128680 RepID=A0A6G4TSD5_9ACTN|nr:hypothetical protein [Streptomyces coryli]NGN62692.1 hypothetical protein [Streptomyces coryli]